MDAELEAPGGLNLAERIRRLANGRNTIDVAQFQFIGLENVRDRYGPQWTAKRERVFQVARHFIARRISPEDVLIPAAEGFLLVFGAFTGVLADAVAHRISTELNTFFLGSPDLDDFKVGTQHEAMSIDEFARVFGELIATSKDLPPQSVARPQAPAIQMGFTPVWDARGGALATYFISPLDPATGYPMDWDLASHRHADMDEMKLNASEQAMQKLFEGKGRALVGVALHVSSLNSQQNLPRLVQAMAKFDRRMARYRVIRVSCVEPGYPRIYLEDIMRNVKQRVPHVAIGLNWAEPDVASVLKLQPAAVGFSLPPGALGSHGPKAEVFSRIHAAAELARHHNVTVGVEGDILPEHALRFAQDGVHHICSPRIWPTRRALTGAEVWPISRLIAPARADTAAQATPA
jgi:hypothetical protein